MAATFLGRCGHGRYLIKSMFRFPGDRGNAMVGHNPNERFAQFGAVLDWIHHLFMVVRP